MSKINFCPKCGKEIEKNIGICMFCGAFLNLHSKDQDSKLEPSNPGDIKAVDYHQRKVILKDHPPQKEEPHEEFILTNSYETISPEKDSKIIYASFPQRVLAWTIDILVLFIPYITISFLIPLQTPTLLFESIIIFLLGNLVFFLYFWGLEAKNNGKTLGKMVLGLKTVNKSTKEKPSYKNCLVNNILRGPLLFIIDIFLAFILITDDKFIEIRYTQKLSQTSVIKKQKSGVLKNS